MPWYIEMYEANWDGVDMEPFDQRFETVEEANAFGAKMLHGWGKFMGWKVIEDKPEDPARGAA